MVILNGISFGLLLAVLIGPVFFTLIQTSIEKGFSKAILVSFGIILSDIFYILLAHLGVTKLLRNQHYDQLLAYIGGIVLISFGIFSLYNSKTEMKLTSTSVEAKGRFRYILRGFLINGLSPFVLLFWVGAMSLARVEYNYKGTELFAFFAIIVIVVIITDLLKALLAVRLRQFITPRFFKVMNILVGVVFSLFGLRMILYSA